MSKSPLAKNSDPVILQNNLAEHGAKIPWGRTLLGLLISAACVYYFSRQIDTVTLTDALRGAKIWPIVWAVVVIVLTGLAKALRWQWLYYPDKPYFRPTFKSIMAGQVINIVSPVPRLGDVARLYQMQQSSQISAGRTLGTLVSEKSFDLLLTVLLAVIIIPIYNVPDVVSQQVVRLTFVVVFIVLALFVLVYQAERILRLVQVCLRPFPEKIAQFLFKLADRSLAGLAVLKHGRVTLYLILLSAGIGILSFLTPLFLFWAFDLSLGLPEALIMNAVLTLSISIPAAPGRIGTFEGFAVAVLLLFGLADDSVNLAYALVYHAVVFLPTMIIGGWALVFSEWRLKDFLRQ